MPRPPEPVDKMAVAELAFFSKALANFTKSGAKFEVVCSVARRHTSGYGVSSSSPSPPSPLVPPARQRSQIHTLVVLDSSFNPPTLAHMKMATSAIRDLRRDRREAFPRSPSVSMRLLLLLSVNNADKAPKPATFEQRLALMLAMARDTHVDLLTTEDPTGPEIPEIPIDIGLTSEPYFHNKSNAIAVSPFYVRPDFSSAADSKTTPDQVFLLGYDTLIRIFDPTYYPPSTLTDPPPDIPEGLPADATPMQIALTPLMRRARLRVTTRPRDKWGDELSQREWVKTTVGALGGCTEDWAAKIDLNTGAYTGAVTVSSTVARDAAMVHDMLRLGELVGPYVSLWLEKQKPYDPNKAP